MRSDPSSPQGKGPPRRARVAAIGRSSSGSSRKRSKKSYGSMARVPAAAPPDPADSLLEADRLAQLAPLLPRVARALDDAGYARVAYVPRLRKPLALVREPLTLWRVLRRSTPLLFASSAVPGLYARLLTPEARRLGRLLIAGEAQPRAALQEALGDAFEPLLTVGVLRARGEQVESRLRVTPYAASYLLADPFSRRDSGVEPVWLGADSLELASYLTRALRGRHFERGLDLGTGSGVQAFAIHPFCDSVVGVDLNPRAVAMAELNRVLQRGDRARFLCGDLAAVVEGEFDLIVSNPPFVAMPESARPGFMDGYGGELGLDVTHRVLDALPHHLAPGGAAILISNAPIVAGRDLLVERLRELSEQAGFAVTVRPLSYIYSEQFAAHQVRVGIERVVESIVEIDNVGKPALRQQAMPPMRALRSVWRVRRIRAATRVTSNG